MSESKTSTALEQFALDTVKVLVGTSMIEEGIDLSSCDTVITYSVEGILHSGKSVIQNAGRARKAGARMFVFCDGVRDELCFEQKKEQILAAHRALLGPVQQ